MTFLWVPGAKGLSLLIKNFRKNPYHNAFGKVQNIFESFNSMVKFQNLQKFCIEYFFSLQSVES